MSPITCSSVGDILAISQLILSIVKAIREVEGAAQDYHDFLRELEALDSVLKTADQRVQNTSSDELRSATVNAIHMCRLDIERASRFILGFDILRSLVPPDATGRQVGVRHLSRGVKKLEWHFMKSSEAAKFTRLFNSHRSLIQVRLSCIIDDNAEVHANQQKKDAEGHVALLREEIAKLHNASDAGSRIQQQLSHLEEEVSLVRNGLANHLISFDVRHTELERLLGHEIADSRFQQHQTHLDVGLSCLSSELSTLSDHLNVNQRESQHRLAIIRDDLRDQSASNLDAMRAMLEAHSRLILEDMRVLRTSETQTHEAIRAQLGLVVFPIWVSTVTLILSQPQVVSHDHPFRRHMPLLALSALVIHGLSQTSRISLRLPSSVCNISEFRALWSPSIITVPETPIIAEPPVPVQPGNEDSLISPAEIERDFVPSSIQHAEVEASRTRHTGEAESSSSSGSPGRSNTVPTTVLGITAYASTLLVLAGSSLLAPSQKLLATSATAEDVAPLDSLLSVATPLRNMNGGEHKQRIKTQSDSSRANSTTIKRFSVPSAQTTEKTPAPPLSLGAIEGGGNDIFEGYMTKSFGPHDTLALLNHLVAVCDCRLIATRYKDESYRYVGSNGQSSPPLDYRCDQKGMIVQQEMWRPSRPGDVWRHFDNAHLQWPIFFHNYAIESEYSSRWPGYPEYRRQVEIKDTRRQPITLFKLVQRIAMFVERWINEVKRARIDPRFANWRVGPGAITKDHLYVVGLVHVGPGTWQPILQLKGHGFY